MSPPTVRVRAPAKINLALRVGPLRADGFHELATVYQAVDLHDEVVAFARDDGLVCVETRGADGRTVPGVADDGSHLAVRAAEALRRRAGLRTGALLQVRKRIPVAGGLAGGSADAAAALVGCAALWGLDTDRDDLLDVAAELGSDVPFALIGGTAHGTGRGERVDSLPAGPRTTWVLVSSPAGLSTPAVFAETDRRRAGRDVPPPRVDTALLEGLARDDLGAVTAGLCNDLQEAVLALRPELAELVDAGRRAGALGTLVSGSGPTLLLLVADDAGADAVAAVVGPVAARVLPGAALRIVHGPVPGPAQTVQA